MTSGSVPEAAPDMISWGIWPSSTPTRWTLMPVFFSNPLMIFWVTAMRSGRFSWDQTVISRSGFPGPVLLAQPVSSPSPKAAVMPTAIAFDRLLLVRIACPRSDLRLLDTHHSITFAG